MRKYAMIVVAMFGLLGLVSGSLHAANTNAMVVNLAFTAQIQAPIITVTNPPNTNATYKVTKVKITNQDVLNMLAAEFGVTFPTGAQLGITTGFEFVVLDKNGNIFKNVSTNLSDSSYVFNITNNSNPIIIGKVLQTATSTTLIVTEIEPDFTVYYADGNGNNYHFGGLVTVKASATQTGSVTLYKTVSLSIAGSGGGDFFNPNDGLYDTGVFTGSWHAAGAGIPQ